VRETCVFTTHTPVEAGHDQFDYAMAARVIGDILPVDQIRLLAGPERLNMTRLALNLSGFINGVARRHAETARRLYPSYPIREITNGVHVASWAHPAIARLLDAATPRWTHEADELVNADLLDDDALWQAHQAAKADLIAETLRRTGVALDPEKPILAFARRMTGYKRPNLIFADIQRLRAIARAQPFQIVMAGKAHPGDEPGKRLIAEAHAHIRALAQEVLAAFLPGYELALARILTAGSDIWLNTPTPPLEASGTSGMKAALNGALNLSVLDGWWVEGCVEGATGWAIGAEGDGPDRHAAALYDKLERVVLPLYHKDRAGWLRMMKASISKIGSRFNTHKMMRRYASEAYLTLETEL
jgi:starch phosphorylase